MNCATKRVCIIALYDNRNRSPGVFGVCESRCDRLKDVLLPSYGDDECIPASDIHERNEVCLYIWAERVDRSPEIGTNYTTDGCCPDDTYVGGARKFAILARCARDAFSAKLFRVCMFIKL